MIYKKKTSIETEQKTDKGAELILDSDAFVYKWYWNECEQWIGSMISGAINITNMHSLFYIVVIPFSQLQCIDVQRLALFRAMI